MALVPLEAAANPVGVKAQIEHGGPVVVSCAPAQCTDAEEKALIETATRLHILTGGRVIVVRTPVNHEAEVYAALTDNLRLGAKDLVLAHDDKGWAVRAPGLPAQMLPELVGLARDATSLQAGLDRVAKEFPGALLARPLPTDAAAAGSANSAPGRAAQPTTPGEPGPSGTAAPPAEAPQAAPPVNEREDGWIDVVPWAAAAVAVATALWAIVRALRRPSPPRG